MLLIIFHILCLRLAYAQPDFTSAIKSNGVVLFGDVTSRNTYYYLPGDLEIARDANGRPDFNFTMMRYNSSAVYGEEEGLRYRNILSMRLVMKNISDDSLRLAKRKLDNNRSSVVLLRPLPITMIDALVVFIPVGGSDTSAVVKRGDLSADGSNGYSTSGSYWQERYFTLHLDNYSAMLLLEAFQEDYTAISFMYAFYSKGSSTRRIPSFSGYGNLAATFQRQLKEDVADTTNTVRECVVKSNAFPIYIDTVKYKDLIRQIDINNGVPPGYAVLNVRNYDFANNLRQDLYEKTVDLQATGAGGGKVDASVTFRSDAPEITSTNFKFKYAVKLNQPYKYRVRELYKDGREEVTEWKDVSMWSALLDVTTRKN